MTVEEMVALLAQRGPTTIGVGLGDSGEEVVVILGTSPGDPRPLGVEVFRGLDLRAVLTAAIAAREPR